MGQAWESRFEYSTGIASALLCVSRALLFGLCFSTNVEAQEPDPSGALVVAQALVDAFNAHDPEAMALLVSPDFELYYVDDDGIAGLALQGPDQLTVEMRSYFASHPSVQSTIADAVDGPVFVSFREQIVGGPSALAVYEVREGLIRRVWYFRAEYVTRFPNCDQL